MTWLKKIAATPHGLAYLLITVNGIGAMAVDIFLPAMPQMVKDLQTSNFSVQSIMMITVLGSTTFRLIWGPLFDAWGHQKIILYVFLFTFIGHFISFIAPNIYCLLFGRLVMSFGMGAIYILSGAVISQHFSGRQRAYMLGLIEMALPFAYVSAPIVGAVLLNITGWRGIFLFILVFQCSSQLLLYYILNGSCEQNHQNNKIEIFKIFESYGKILSEPLFLIYCFIPGLAIGTYAMFVATSPFIYMNQFQLQPSTFAIYQAMPLIIGFIALVTYRRIVHHVGVDQALGLGVFGYACFSLIVIGIILKWFTLQPNSLLSIICLLTFCNAFIVTPAIYHGTELFSNDKGTAFSVVSFSRGIVVGVCMSFGGVMFSGHYHSIFVAMAIVAIVILGLSAIALILSGKIPELRKVSLSSSL